MLFVLTLTLKLMIPVSTLRKRNRRVVQAAGVVEYSG